MPSAGGQVPTHTRRAGLGEGLGDREAEAAVVCDAGDESALAREVDAQHEPVFCLIRSRRRWKRGRGEASSRASFLDEARRVGEQDETNDVQAARESPSLRPSLS